MSAVGLFKYLLHEPALCNITCKYTCKANSEVNLKKMNKNRSKYNVQHHHNFKHVSSFCGLLGLSLYIFTLMTKSNQVAKP